MLILGAIAGWLGSLIFSGRGLGLFGNIIVGIVGSAVGYWSLGELGISFVAGSLNTVWTGVAGAVVILIILNLVFSGRRF